MNVYLNSLGSVVDNGGVDAIANYHFHETIVKMSKTLF